MCLISVFDRGVDLLVPAARFAALCLPSGSDTAEYLTKHLGKLKPALEDTLRSSHNGSRLGIRCQQEQQHATEPSASAAPAAARP
jgi:hypothetical protein